MMNERIHTIMTTKIVTVHPEDTLEVVKKLLFEKRFHHLPVVENKKLVGIVTSWDLIRYNKKFEEYDKHKVHEIMTRKIATLGPDESIGAAAMIFLKHLFHGLPIIDDENNLLGIITTHDLLKKNFMEEYPDDIFLKETGWMDH